MEVLSGIVRRKRAEGEQQSTDNELERTAELVFVNAHLHNEILERGRAEPAREATIRHLRSILEGIGDAFVSLDRDWRITCVNTLWSQLSYSRDITEHRRTKEVLLSDPYLMG